MMKTSELTGALLDYWVAKAQGFTGPVSRPGHVKAMDWITPSGCRVWFGAYKPHRNWSQAGPIIEREGIAVWRGWKQWVANMPGGSDYQGDINYIDTTNQFGTSGPTPLVAAMRAYVASKFGDEVPDA